jgi:hypothetical protein
MLDLAAKGERDVSRLCSAALGQVQRDQIITRLVRVLWIILAGLLLSRFGDQLL